jgi:hypothetical protein
VINRRRLRRVRLLRAARLSAPAVPFEQRLDPIPDGVADSDAVGREPLRISERDQDRRA